MMLMIGVLGVYSIIKNELYVVKSFVRLVLAKTLDLSFWQTFPIQCLIWSFEYEQSIQLMQPCF